MEFIGLGQTMFNGDLHIKTIGNNHTIKIEGFDIPQFNCKKIRVKITVIK